MKLLVTALLLSFHVKLVASLVAPAAFSADKNKQDVAGAISDGAFLRAPHNFGPASSRDSVLFTAERPGNPKGDKLAPVDDESVFEWIEFMRNENQISHVLALLDENEFSNYEPSGLLRMYEQGGLKYTVQSMSDANACENVCHLLMRAEADNERVVAHCTGGIGRAGRVAGGWLSYRYGLSPEKAADEVLLQAKLNGVTRNCDAEKLAQWMERFRGTSANQMLQP